MIMAILFAASARVLLVGFVKTAAIDLLFRIDGDQVIGAVYRSYGRKVSLVTGTARNGHLMLRERSDPWTEVAAIDAQLSDDGLRGTWGGQAFGLFPFGTDSPLVRDDTIAWPMFEDLHDEIRAGREDGDRANFDVRLLCAITDEGCDWLASKRVPIDDPAKALRECEEGRRMPCLFLRDLLVRMPERERKECERVLCEGHDVACIEYWGATEVSLSEAAQRGDVREVERLLARHPNVNFGNDRYPRPLLSAINVRSLEMVKLLVEHGADPNAGTEYWTPLDLAVTFANYDIAGYLVEHGAKGNRALAEVIDRGYHELAIKMLDHGVDPDSGFPSGSALTFAVDDRDLPMVRALLAHCARTDFTTKFSGGSPIDHARRIGAKKILALLLAAKDAPCTRSAP